MNALSRRSALACVASAAVSVPAIALALPNPPTVISPSPDAALLKLADEYLLALAEHGRQFAEWCRWDEKQHEMNPRPEAMRYRETDEELELPARYGHRPEFYEIGDYDGLRASHWYTVEDVPEEVKDIAFSAIVGFRKKYYEPSAEQRARADEICAALKEYEKIKDREPRGMKAAWKRYSRAMSAEYDMRKEVEATKAVTLDGMLAKARCAAAHAYKGKIKSDADMPMEELAVSIVRDLTQLLSGGRNVS